MHRQSTLPFTSSISPSDFGKATPTIEALKDVSLDHRARRVRRRDGRQRLGQEHAAARHGRTDAARRGTRRWSTAKTSSAMSDYQLTLFRRRRIGLVFQAFNLIPTLTARDNILLPLLADGRGAVGRRPAGRPARPARPGRAPPPSARRPQRRRAAARGHRPGDHRRSRRSSWPTSRPAASIRSPARASAGCCRSCARSKGGRSSS